MDLVTYSRTCLLACSSTIQRKLWQSRVARNSTTTKEKQLPRTRNRTWCSSTTSQVTHRIFKRKSLCFNTLSHTWSKTMIPRKKSNSFRETNWTRQISCSIRLAPSTSKNGCERNTPSCSASATRSFRLTSRTTQRSCWTQKTATWRTWTRRVSDRRCHWTKHWIATMLRWQNDWNTRRTF